MKADNKILDKITAKLVQAYHPRAIYLFGSYAWGNPSAESDYDLLVIIDDTSDPGKPKELKGQHALADIGVPKDIIVMSEQAFRKQASHVSTLFYKIKKEAVKIYGAA